MQFKELPLKTQQEDSMKSQTCQLLLYFNLQKLYENTFLLFKPLRDGIWLLNHERTKLWKKVITTLQR